MTPSGAVVALGLLAVSGCAQPDETDPWGSARRACLMAVQEHHDWTLLLPERDGALNGLELPEGCAEGLLAPLHADPERMLRDLGVQESLDVHVEQVRRGEAPPDGLATLVWAVAWLMGADYGRVDDVDAGPFSDVSWSEEFRSMAIDLGLDSDADLGKVLFVDAVQRVKGVRWLPSNAPERAVMQMTGTTHVLGVPRTIDVAPELRAGFLDPSLLAWSLFHESVHARGGAFRHVKCREPATESGRVCDVNGAGAYGGGYAVGWAELRAITGGEPCVASGIVGHVVEANFAVMRDGWSRRVMSPLLSEQLPPCASP